ncbi:hypothetical protein BC936DRAFT_139039 [Jimgerdemannia flammicorona]|uniref:Uncharacterized protein n=1 Tax=Jimgerdemannia flammicorona TaxID=994334 RepID=A0A433DHW5_9FUNG|nr:hypothetical protein BC936DRAFT_139039 [Jimgerdemannia flammicorona]
MPKEVFETRALELQAFAHQRYRAIPFLENLNFITIPIAIILMAIYGLVGKYVILASRYWSVFIFAPVIVTLLVSARAATMKKTWLIKWEVALSIAVKNMTKNDIPSFGIRWTWRKLGYGSNSFTYIVDIMQADVDMDVDVLPAYHDAMLEAPPPPPHAHLEMHGSIHPHTDLPHYDDLEELEMTSMARLGLEVGEVEVDLSRLRVIPFEGEVDHRPYENL